VLHILWNNKFEIVDRTLLMLYYRLMGRRVVMTAHNVNAGRRDLTDGRLNRASLRIQYGMCDFVFVHTERMKRELEALGVSPEKAVVIPYGINDAVPTTGLTRHEARARLGVGAGEKTMLFFGQIAPYKGLDVLVASMPDLLQAGEPVRLLVVGKVKRGWEDHWEQVQRRIRERGLDAHVTRHVRFVPDEEIEQYFKAADVVILPYRDIFQSGVLFLASSFGVPVIATDVGSMRDDIIEDRTGLVCRPGDASDLGRAIARYFAGGLYRNLDARRDDIRQLASERHSWTKVAEITRAAYAQALSGR
jgi:glycosyltransferase involved in cell wall biosynthesis